MATRKRFLDPADPGQLDMLKLTLQEEAVGFDEITAAIQGAVDDEEFAAYVAEHEVLCPSTRPTDDAFLFGVIDEQVEIRYLRHPIPIDRRLAHALQQIDLPQRRFRFTHRCIECGHWQQQRCSVAASVKRAAAALDDEDQPVCSLRKYCR
jgi:hypothetical protein